MKLLRIPWPEHGRKDEVSDKGEINWKYTFNIRKRGLTFFGHIMKKGALEI